jgi:iron-sulfur cluster assembly protein
LRSKLNCQWSIASGRLPGVDDSEKINTMIQLSPTATTEILRLKARSQESDPKLRIAVISNGCLPFSYSLCFASIVQSGDRTYPCDPITVIVNSELLPYLDGLVIDYSEDLMGGGFRFHNPNASQTCSCGNSFATGEPILA